MKNTFLAESSMFRRKAVAGFAVAVFTIAAAAAVSLVVLRKVEFSRERLMQQYVQELISVEDLQDLGETMTTAGRGYLIAGDSESARRLSEARQEFWTALGRMKAVPLSPAARENVADAEDSARAYERVLDSLLPVRRLGHAASLIRRFESELRPRRDRLYFNLGSFKSQVQDRLARDERVSNALSTRVFAFAALLIFVGSALAALLGWYLSKSLTAIYQKEREARQSREDVLAVVSHDLKAPLTSLRLNCDLIRRLLSRGDSGSGGIEKSLDIMRRGVDQMGRMIADLLDLARMESGVFTVFPSVVGLSEVSRNIETTFAPLAAHKGVRLDISPASEVIGVYIDRDRVQQAAGNLVSNAIKFTPPQGAVSIKTMISGNSLSIVVSDEGPGIPPAQLRWIFERYRQARESDRRQGSGLGLYIVKGIMEAHGGTVHVETGSSGRGSRFILTFPDAVRFSAISRIG